MKPLSIKWMIALNYLKIALAVLFIFAVVLLILVIPNLEYGEAILNMLSKKAGDGSADKGYLIGYFTGFMGIPIILSLLQIFLIRSKKRTGFWITFSLDFLITISSTYIFILFPIVLLIIGISRSARNYFKKDYCLVPEEQLLDRME
jgi:hypothetical protein